MEGMNKLDRLEILAQRLIEGTFHRLFHTQLHPADLAHHLALAIEKGRPSDSLTRTGVVIPHHYRIVLNPADYAALVDESGQSAEVVATIRDYLLSLIQEGDYQLAGPLHISLDKGEAISPGRVEIKTDQLSW